MLRWNAPQGEHHYHATMGRAGAGDVAAAIVATWAKFLDGLDALGAAPWTIILAYLEVEVGGVLLYATTREEPGAVVGDLTVRVDFEDWMAEYAAICGPDDRSAAAEARFERRYGALLRKMARAIKPAIADPTLAPRFAALKRRDRFAIAYVDQGETVHAPNLVHLWGARPPRAFPAATPRMLFVGLMQKAGINPDDCLKLRGDQVIEATFFGNEFDDRYVDIIGSVPDVAALCKDLRVLTLRATRIKPAGVGRLEALLPHARIKLMA